MVFCNRKHGLNELEAASCHNPYFNRWFSAISDSTLKGSSYEMSQSLF